MPVLTCPLFRTWIHDPVVMDMSMLARWWKRTVREYDDMRGEIAKKVVKAAQNFCSAYPDVTQVGVGGDVGAGLTAGGQVTLNANGNSGELTLSVAPVINVGIVAYQAYAFGGVVRNAPTNQSLEGMSYSFNVGVGKTGISANKNNPQVTVGPSMLPFTYSGQVSETHNLVTIPYAGYVMNDIKGVCTLAFGKHD